MNKPGYMNSCHRGKTLIKLVNLTNSIYNLTTMAVELKKMALKLLTEELRRQGMLVGDHMNNAVNEIIRTISIFFKKCKIKYFTPLRTFSARKIVAFVVFCSPVFDLLVGFGLIYVFVRSRFFRKKKNWFEIVLITSFTILLTCTPINSPIENYLSLILAQIFLPHLFIYIRAHLLLFVGIYFYLSIIIFACKNFFSFMIIFDDL